MEYFYISLIVTFLFVCLLFIQNLFNSSDEENISNALLLKTIFAVFIATYISHQCVFNSQSFGFQSSTKKIDTKW